MVIGLLCLKHSSSSFLMPRSLESRFKLLPPLQTFRRGLAEAVTGGNPAAKKKFRGLSTSLAQLWSDPEPNLHPGSL
jgi:hypothetical protein